MAGLLQLVTWRYCRNIMCAILPVFVILCYLFNTQTYVIQKEAHTDTLIRDVISEHGEDSGVQILDIRNIVKNRSRDVEDSRLSSVFLKALPLNYTSRSEEHPLSQVELVKLYENVNFEKENGLAYEGVSNYFKCFISLLSILIMPLTI